MSNIDFLCIGWIDTSLLTWAVLQTTMVAIVTYALILIMRRVSPESRVFICGLGLLCMSILPTVTMMRASGWSWGQWLQETGNANAIQTSAPRLPNDQTGTDINLEPSNELELWQQVLLSSTKLLSKVESVELNVNTRQSEPQSNWLGLFVACGVLLGVVRLVLGIFQVNRLRAGASLLSMTEIDTEIGICARRLGVKKTVLIGVSKHIGTAAVVGWRRPMLLLPCNWQDWSKLERSAIFAHELAHIRRADYLTTAIAQVAVAVNFFHPLAHALIARLRLNQELAADALAANVIGGSQQYVEILASLVLRQPMVRTPGPAQAFLPPRRMFVRRLEMLSRMRRRGNGWSRFNTCLASSIVIAATVLATGLRPFEAKAQDGANRSTQKPVAATAEKELIQLIPPSVIEGVIQIDVAAILALPPAVDVLKSLEQEIQRLPVDLYSIESMLVLIPVSGDRARETRTPGLPEPILLLRFKETANVPDSAALAGARKLGDRTLVMGGPERLRAAIGAYPSDKYFDPLLARHDNAAIRAAAKLSWIKNVVQAERAPQGHPFLAFAPLWEKVEAVSLGIELNDSLSISGNLNSGEAQDVADTLTALKVLAKNYLAQITKELGSSVRDPMELMLMNTAISQASQLLNSVKITAKDEQVEMKAQIDSGIYETIQFLLPALQRARIAATRSQSSNNMKQLMLALYNYLSAYNRFPAAVTIDPETGVERSWRVEILPFLGEQQLYEMYRKNEPWDSEANLQVLSRMPRVFTLPGKDSVNETPYQAIVSEGGGLTPGDDGNGPVVTDFADGISNTVVLVETLPMVPWTKPVDVDDAMAALESSVRPSENGFLVARGDGSVSFISSTIDRIIWKALTTRAGGEVVPQQ